MRESQHPEIGIAAIAAYAPSWKLSNDWFGSKLPNKFVHQTGIVTRHVSEEDEVLMAVRAAEKLQREFPCEWRDCAGIIFSAPSFVPLQVVKHYCTEDRVQQEHLPKAARRFAQHLGLENRSVHAVNWFCSGFAKGLQIALRPQDRKLILQQNQFLLVVNSSRISRITDYGCRQTGALFGDMATVTLISRTDSPLYPPHFQILYADAKRYATDGVFFDFHLRENVVSPSIAGQHQTDAQRLVFSLNGMGIAESAPRAMTKALAEACEVLGLPFGDLRFVVPHQAGAGIVRLAAMKMESAGVRGQVVNGIANDIGNVSSCSIPYALNKMWNNLDGYIACPTAAVGQPGRPEMSQGCIVLKTLAPVRGTMPAPLANLSAIAGESTPCPSW